MIPSFNEWLQGLTSKYYKTVKDCFMYPYLILSLIKVLYSMCLSESLYTDRFEMVFYLLITFTLLIGTLTEHLLPQYKPLALLFIFETAVNLSFSYIYFANPTHPMIYIMLSTLLSQFFIYFINIQKYIILSLQMKNLFLIIYLDMKLHEDYSIEPLNVFLILLVIISNIRMTISREKIFRILYNNQMHMILANEKLSSIINSMPVGIIVLSLDLKVILSNNLFHQKFNVRTNRQIKCLIGSLKYSPGRRDYFEKENEEYLMNDIKRYIQNLANPPTTFGIVERNGYYYEWRGNMTLWEDFHAVILTARNVTSLIQLERSRAEAACKNAMLRSVSHELRTPTAIISSSAEQIEEDAYSNLTESSKESLNMITVCSKILLNIIHDLIDFSQIISGQFNIVRMKFSIQDLLNECIFLVSTQCRKKNLSLHLALDPRLPSFAVNDANRIRQVILNLISNALKFTFHGRIVLSAKLRSSNQVKISVYDTGTGISQESLQKIFKLFSDMSDGFIESHGCGLGLHISSLIVQKLGGNITVKSTPNIGSKFSFLFDLGMIYETDSECESDFCRVPSEAETSSLIHIPTMAVKLSQQGKPTPILIADDNEFNRKILCHFFESENLRYDEACNGVQAVDMTRTKNKGYNSYRVIIMDCQMPKMDGWTASKTIHDMFHNQEIKYLPKIIGYTAYTGTEEYEKCINSGMVDCLYKPTSRYNLLRVVRRYLDIE